MSDRKRPAESSPPKPASKRSARDVVLLAFGQQAEPFETLKRALPSAASRAEELAEYELMTVGIQLPPIIQLPPVGNLQAVGASLPSASRQPVAPLMAPAFKAATGTFLQYRQDILREQLQESCALTKARGGLNVHAQFEGAISKDITDEAPVSSGAFATRQDFVKSVELDIEGLRKYWSLSIAAQESPVGALNSIQTAHVFPCTRPIPGLNEAASVTVSVLEIAERSFEKVTELVTTLHFEWAVSSQAVFSAIATHTSSNAASKWHICAIDVPFVSISEVRPGLFALTGRKTAGQTEKTADFHLSLPLFVKSAPVESVYRPDGPIDKKDDYDASGISQRRAKDADSVVTFVDLVSRIAGGPRGGFEERKREIVRMMSAGPNGKIYPLDAMLYESTRAESVALHMRICAEYARVPLCGTQNEKMTAFNIPLVLWTPSQWAWEASTPSALVTVNLLMAKTQKTQNVDGIGSGDPKLHEGRFHWAECGANLHAWSKSVRGKGAIPGNAIKVNWTNAQTLPRMESKLVQASMQGIQHLHISPAAFWHAPLKALDNDMAISEIEREEFNQASEYNETRIAMIASVALDCSILPPTTVRVSVRTLKPMHCVTRKPGGPSKKRTNPFEGTTYYAKSSFNIDIWASLLGDPSMIKRLSRMATIESQLASEQSGHDEYAKLKLLEVAETEFNKFRVHYVDDINIALVVSYSPGLYAIIVVNLTETDPHFGPGATSASTVADVAPATIEEATARADYVIRHNVRLANGRYMFVESPAQPVVVGRMVVCGRRIVPLLAEKCPSIPTVAQLPPSVGGPSAEKYAVWTYDQINGRWTNSVKMNTMVPRVVSQAGRLTADAPGTSVFLHRVPQPRLVVDDTFRVWDDSAGDNSEHSVPPSMVSQQQLEESRVLRATVTVTTAVDSSMYCVRVFNVVYACCPAGSHVVCRVESEFPERKIPLTLLYGGPTLTASAEFRKTRIRKNKERSQRNTGTAAFLVPDYGLGSFKPANSLMFETDLMRAFDNIGSAISASCEMLKEEVAIGQLQATLDAPQIPVLQPTSDQAGVPVIVPALQPAIVPALQLVNDQAVAPAVDDGLPPLPTDDQAVAPAVDDGLPPLPTDGPSMLDVALKDLFN